jgi:hypothetical protein
MLRESVVLHESFFGIKAGPLGSLFFYGFLEADVAIVSLQRGRLQFQEPLGLTQLDDVSQVRPRDIVQDPESLS